MRTVNYIKHRESHKHRKVIQNNENENHLIEVAELEPIDNIVHSRRTSPKLMRFQFSNVAVAKWICHQIKCSITRNNKIDSIESNGLESLLHVRTRWMLRAVFH